MTGDELTRGLPGEPLTAGDLTLLELKPLKAFLPGEVCKLIPLYNTTAVNSKTRYIILFGGKGSSSTFMFWPFGTVDSSLKSAEQRFARTRRKSVLLYFSFVPILD